MKMIVKEVFPIIFYEFKFSKEQILPICEEIAAKKTEIKKRYEDSDIDKIKKIDYWTDFGRFGRPIELVQYENLVVKEISSQFLPEMQCEHVVHWTAIYEEKGYHEAHNHSPMLHTAPTCNMSSILYLSDIGYTEFVNPKLDAATCKSFLISSQVGKMIMFPSHVLHSALPHGKKDEEKIIVSSNWKLYDSSPDLIFLDHMKGMQDILNSTREIK